MEAQKKYVQSLYETQRKRIKSQCTQPEIEYVIEDDHLARASFTIANEPFIVKVNVYFSDGCNDYSVEIDDSGVYGGLPRHFVSHYTYENSLLVSSIRNENGSGETVFVTKTYYYNRSGKKLVTIERNRGSRGYQIKLNFEGFFEKKFRDWLRPLFFNSRIVQDDIEGWVKCWLDAEHK